MATLYVENERTRHMMGSSRAVRALLQLTPRSLLRHLHAPESEGVIRRVLEDTFLMFDENNQQKMLRDFLPGDLIYDPACEVAGNRPEGIPCGRVLETADGSLCFYCSSCLAALPASRSDQSFMEYGLDFRWPCAALGVETNEEFKPRRSPSINMSFAVESSQLSKPIGACHVLDYLISGS
jgi:hypothetical protein